jgi:N6-L-threonylcarbamoyladenine synthase
MKILGIETSCDETSAAVVDDGTVLSNIISSQFVHQRYGGVVPELASRAHQRLIVPVVDEALQVAAVRTSELDGIAATYGPGLVGALLVGLNFAKALAFSLGKPFVAVNHMEAHLYSNLIEHADLKFPYLCLTVSGGHTQLVLVRALLDHKLLGETLDDAAGEAYDKVAKMLGLGFPGGPIVDKLAREGNPDFAKFPRSFLDAESLDFSFSGIKTSVLYWLRDRGLLNESRASKLTPRMLSDICASFQAAIVDVLVGKTLSAAERYGVDNICVAGGVSANSELRRRMEEIGRRNSLRVFFPGIEYCTDNGAMVAYVGWIELMRGMTTSFEVSAVANLPI